MDASSDWREFVAQPDIAPVPPTRDPKQALGLTRDDVGAIAKALSRDVHLEIRYLIRRTPPVSVRNFLL